MPLTVTHSGRKSAFICLCLSRVTRVMNSLLFAWKRMDPECGWNSFILFPCNDNQKHDSTQQQRHLHHPEKGKKSKKRRHDKLNELHTYTHCAGLPLFPFPLFSPDSRQCVKEVGVVVCCVCTSFQIPHTIIIWQHLKQKCKAVQAIHTTA